MSLSLKKCLVANRGEIAVRIIRACRELGIAAVAVYSDADANALHVRLADEAHPIGAANAAESYLNGTRLVETALAAGCDCVHPGYGFLSESAEFAQAVIDAGLVWVGPPPDAIRRMGVKTEARARMEAAGVPLVPGFQRGGDDAAFKKAAKRLGYPVMVKAAGGGGGKGMRIVRQAADLPDALASARREALHAFGDERVFLERYVERARHVEIQVLADAHGSIVHLFERECSAQRRHQKVVEESPARIDDALRERMGAAGVAAAKAVGYVNAGTVEFILTPEGEFYFLEMNTRLQVEHPVTELVTGLDLVRLQFAVAAGEKLPFTQAELNQRGHAIECRVYAESPRDGFLPSPGEILLLRQPSGLGVRVDAGVESGDAVPIHYDPMIAKIIVYDRTRAEAIRRMDAALRETVILGTTSNLDFLRALVNHPAFAAGEIDTGFIERHLSELIPPEPALPDEVLVALTLDALTQNAQGGMNGVSETMRAANDPWSRADSFRIGEEK